MSLILVWVMLEMIADTRLWVRMVIVWRLWVCTFFLTDLGFVLLFMTGFGVGFAVDVDVERVVFEFCL